LIGSVPEERQSSERFLWFCDRRLSSLRHFFPIASARLLKRSRFFLVHCSGCFSFLSLVGCQCFVWLVAPRLWKCRKTGRDFVVGRVGLASSVYLPDGSLRIAWVRPVSSSASASTSIMWRRCATRVAATNPIRCAQPSRRSRRAPTASPPISRRPRHISRWRHRPHYSGDQDSA